MKHTLIFSTGNAHKVSEVRQIAGDDLTILTPAEAGLASSHFPETSDTLEGNARQKARALYDICQCDCLAEDTGLEVDALGGAPGVISARYAGPQRNAEDNINKLLSELADSENRTAQFRTIIALWWEQQEYIFEGIVKGTIAIEPFGRGGFGYDPVFIPDGHTQTFAELSDSIKNTLSHRADAITKMLLFLNTPIQR
jgi:XTP/dITP diphosphohydrolase